MKIRRTKDRYFCHDELLFDLFNLSEDTIKYEIINEEPYLVNTVKGKGYELSLRTKIDKKYLYDELHDGDSLIDVRENNKIFGNINRDILLQNYSSRLYLSSLEKYIFNSLLDKYLDAHGIFNITIKEIESNYRGRASSTRNITLNSKTFNRYIEAIDSLSKKEIVIKTTNYFRKKCYGVNNIESYQPLLKITSSYLASVNNVSFQYSFGLFGTILKNSKRYAAYPPAFYRVRLNRLDFHLVCFYLCREVFIDKGRKSRYLTDLNKGKLNIDIDKIVQLVNSNQQHNKLRYFRKIEGYIEGCLEVLEYDDKIGYFDVKYHYEETEHFVKKHEFDYDEFDDMKKYKFSLDDLDRSGDVNIEISVYYGPKPEGLVLNA